MNRIVSLCVFVVALTLAVPTFGASKSSKYHPLTKKYHNASLEQVLNDLEQKTGYKLAYVREDMDLNARVTATFKETPAKTVLKKVLEKNRYDITSKKGVITIALKPAPPTTYEVKATTPSEIQDDSIKTVRIWQDTTYSVACKTVTKELPQAVVEEPTPTSKGHYLQAFLGAGYSQVGYKEPEGMKDKGLVGALAQLQYAYYFHENWGVTAGVGFDFYSSKGVMNHVYEWTDQSDSEGEKYIHRAEAKDWTEKQLMGMVNIPIGVQCQYPLNDNNLRLYAGAGVKVGIPVFATQQLGKGEVKHTGFYEKWGMTMQEDLGNLGNDRDFYTETTDAFTLGKQLKSKMVAASVMADLGVAIPVAEQIDVLVGAYFDYCLNDIKDGDQQPMGWKQPNFPEDKSYRQHEFMAEYPGMVAASEALRPWQIGVKVGVQWHHKEKAKPAPKEYERIQVCDTTFTLAQRTDTTFKPQAAKKIVRMMNKAVIWFDLDKAEPKLEPADIIDRIADVLKENPEQKILVNGHASAEGNADHNQMLSEKRAQAVADLLLEKGVPAEQITVKGFSSQYEYIATEEQAEDGHHNISLDRRVEIIPVTE
ncbi:MAG: OmpA family protein [Paludibacteraceae bacterium]|nr:OmpA family protein [Paludibacteraceae bacterium]